MRDRAVILVAVDRRGEATAIRHRCELALACATSATIEAIDQGFLIRGLRVYDALSFARALSRPNGWLHTIRIVITVDDPGARDDLAVLARFIVPREGEIVCTQAIAELAVDHALASARPLGTFRLDEPSRTFSLHALVDPVGVGPLTYLDPVCGALVADETVHSMVMHDGARIHFCSHRCAEMFDREPPVYVAPLWLAPGRELVATPGAGVKRQRRAMRIDGCRPPSRRTTRRHSSLVRLRRTRISLACWLLPFAFTCTDLLATSLHWM